jgi:hypothetical protein
MKALRMNPKNIWIILLSATVMVGCKVGSIGEYFTPAENNSSCADTQSSLHLTAEPIVSIDVLTPCSYPGQPACLSTDEFKASDSSEQSSEVKSDVDPASMQSIETGFSSHTPIFVRLSGSDDQGDGTAAAPFATPQKAFELAYSSVGDFVLDIGEGDYQGVNLGIAAANEWPKRIAIRGAGAGAGVTKLGGIHAVGEHAKRSDKIPTSGRNITIISNNSIQLGPIDARGGKACCNKNEPSATPGTVELLGVVAGTINVEGGRGPINGSLTPSDGGTITAVYSSLGDLLANGVNDNGDGIISNGGIINLISSQANIISANGGSKLSEGCGAHGGRVYLKNSSIKGANLSGGSGQDGNGDLCDGQLGSVRTSK